MILELALGGAVLVTAGGALRWLLHRGAGIQQRSRTDPDEPQSPVSSALGVGDVLLIDDDELWLAGGIWLDGDVSVRLFSTPGHDRDGWLAQLELPSAVDLVVLHPTEMPAGRVADEIQVAGVRFRARSRARVAVRTEGEDLPAVTERADLTVLSGPGGQYAIVVDFIAGDRLTLSGTRIEPARIDHLPGSHR